MKKLLAILLALVMVLSLTVGLTACNSGESESSKSDDKEDDDDDDDEDDKKDKKKDKKDKDEDKEIASRDKDGDATEKDDKKKSNNLMGMLSGTGEMGTASVDLLPGWEESTDMAGDEADLNGMTYYMAMRTPMEEGIGALMIMSMDLDGMIDMVNEQYGLDLSDEDLEGMTFGEILEQADINSDEFMDSLIEGISSSSGMLGNEVDVSDYDVVTLNGYEAIKLDMSVDSAEVGMPIDTVMYMVFEENGLHMVMFMEMLVDGGASHVDELETMVKTFKIS